MKTSVIITSKNEPNLIGRAIKSFQNQTHHPTEIICSIPDKETIKEARKYKVKIIKDKGIGKSSAINQILKKVKSDILILTDGDCHVNNIAVEEILKPFINPKIGCVSGRVIPTNNPTTKFGYFAHILSYGAHIERLRRSGDYLEATGYLFAFRNIIKKIPTDIAEDTIIPLILHQKGYKIGYSSKSEVYVKYPETLSDFVNQKSRTVKSHKNINKYTKNAPKMKTFTKEITIGLPIILSKSLREILWTFELIILRLVVWFKSKGNYTDNWERIESTK